MADEARIKRATEKFADELWAAGVNIGPRPEWTPEKIALWKKLTRG